ncbi:pyridoxamine 5'-phosphate oxidase family protein [Noviherbaspirillum sp. CPCC 100848]|uniref:Pyridoxamine 5'-phosphate oxidase family protein n=1 Tax=Noviherbaspirillum album TaxID=3080276 RepID=A0ABU6JFP1_9BURK|nr:MSMEG_1061 family FMN-dependent PPOX-type flavoprotein [Noviherbaspirillum sp. CPCC 100848]MEC4721919.1 pyridoxamine 5'-phosphate oxidase family protein [Noviherbaspirillum sp. CPCC 100848]
MNDALNDEFRISSLDNLERLYGPPNRTSRQEAPHIKPEFHQFIEKAPFVVLSTIGPDGLDASAKGDAGGFVDVIDEKTLLIPERGSHGRNDSLRNIVADPRVALIFLVPGISTMLRVCGRAHVSVNPDFLARFPAKPGLVSSVIVVHVEEAFLQCARALEKSGLWTSDP